MLDRVLGGARDLRRTLPPWSDQQKLDEYLDSVRSVERRIAAIESRQQEAALEKAGVGRPNATPAIRRPSRSRSPRVTSAASTCRSCATSTSSHFQTDTTRVSTYIGSTPNGVSYPELGFTDSTTRRRTTTTEGNGPEGGGHHKFNIDQFAYMVKKMASLREGDGTLLDNCIMMWGSGLEDGNKHRRENLPFIIAGKAADPSRPAASCQTPRATRRPAHHAALLRRRPAGPPDRHRDQADRRNEGLIEAVKKWDWLRAEDAKTLGNR
jgi:hypothetical protein